MHQKGQERRFSGVSLAASTLAITSTLSSCSLPSSSDSLADRSSNKDFREADRGQETLPHGPHGEQLVLTDSPITLPSAFVATQIDYKALADDMAEISSAHSDPAELARALLDRLEQEYGDPGSLNDALAEALPRLQNFWLATEIAREWAKRSPELLSEGLRNLVATEPFGTVSVQERRDGESLSIGSNFRVPEESANVKFVRIALNPGHGEIEIYTPTQNDQSFVLHQLPLMLGRDAVGFRAKVTVACEPFDDEQDELEFEINRGVADYRYPEVLMELNSVDASVTPKVILASLKEAYPDQEELDRVLSATLPHLNDMSLAHDIAREWMAGYQSDWVRELVDQGRFGRFKMYVGTDNTLQIEYHFSPEELETRGLSSVMLLVSAEALDQAGNGLGEVPMMFLPRAAQDPTRIQIPLGSSDGPQAPKSELTVGYLDRTGSPIVDYSQIIDTDGPRDPLAGGMNRAANNWRFIRLQAERNERELAQVRDEHVERLETTDLNRLALLEWPFPSVKNTMEGELDLTNYDVVVTASVAQWCANCKGAMKAMSELQSKLEKHYPGKVLLIALVEDNDLHLGRTEQGDLSSSGNIVKYWEDGGYSIPIAMVEDGKFRAYPTVTVSRVVIDESGSRNHEFHTLGFGSRAVPESEQVLELLRELN